MPWTEPPTKRAYACNADLLLYLRERKTWTQKELASEVGYSERLIMKAESGRSISVSTIDDLAEALSTPEEAICPEDLICNPTVLSKKILEAWYTHQKNFVKEMRHYLDEDVVIKIAGEPERIPIAGTYYGIAGYQEFTDIFFSNLEVPAGYDHEGRYQFFSQGMDVITWGESWAHPIGVPLEKPMEITNHFRFHRGKLILYEDMFDTKFGEEVFEKWNAIQKRPG